MASMFDNVGGAVSDIYSARANEYKAQGAEYEAEAYRKGADLADTNANFTFFSTRIKEAQADRQSLFSAGRTSADIAGAGFGKGGTSLDLMRDAASQGAMTRGILTSQGYITEEGYKEQASSYRSLASAADMTAGAYREAASGSYFSAGVKGFSALFTGGPAAAFSGGGG